jgi:hypothetical protein
VRRRGWAFGGVLCRFYEGWGGEVEVDCVICGAVALLRWWFGGFVRACSDGSLARLVLLEFYREDWDAQLLYICACNGMEVKYVSLYAK